MGLGIFATQFIPKGTIVFVLDKLDLVLRPDNPIIDHPGYTAFIHKYSYIDANGDRILCWDHAKYMNHSCRPNTMSTTWGFDIAIEDVPAGDELTCEYGLLNIECDMACACGMPDCRSIISPADINRYADNWDKQLKLALNFVPNQPQPLESFLSPAEKSMLHSYLETGTGYKSVRDMMYSSPALNGKSKQVHLAAK